ncbi:hypothetical protein BKI52_32025 [marine bacterium AO1-C]|nr:hypothetical protein BKI52_32025 [marine bacterium AO1-C]
MLKNISLIFSITIGLIISAKTYSQTSSSNNTSSTSAGGLTAPKFSNEFMNIGVGARALGMANTQVSIVQDVTAGYWNPAGLLDIKTKYDVALMHSEYFGGIIQYDYVGFATPIDSLSHLAISAIRLGADDIPDTRFLYDADGQLNYDNIRFFGVADYGFLISYARHLPLIPGLKWGANFKIIHRSVGNFANAWGFGLDAGVKLDLKSGWHFGVMARDITGTFNAWSHNTALVAEVFAQTGNAIPRNSIEVTIPRLIVSAAKEFTIRKKFGALISFDLNTTFDGRRNVPINGERISIDPSMGLELNYLKRIFLRGGVHNIQQIKNAKGGTFTSFQPTFGVGIRVSRFNIDYAFTDIANQSEALSSHVFSLKIAINK